MKSIILPPGYPTAGYAGHIILLVQYTAMDIRGGSPILILIIYIFIYFFNVWDLYIYIYKIYIFNVIFLNPSSL